MLPPFKVMKLMWDLKSLFNGKHRIKKTKEIGTLIDSVKVVIVPTLWDNYSYLLISDNEALIIDPSEFKPINNEIKARNLKISGILLTHDHIDHVKDIGKISKKFKVNIYASEYVNIPTKYTIVKDDFILKIGKITIKAIELPGHYVSFLPIESMKNNIGWYSKDAGIMFTGDILFACNYGSIGNADPKHMFESLYKIRKMDGCTKLFYGHEYFERTMQLGLAIDTGNKALALRYENGKECLNKGCPSVPVELQTEKETNPFLRWDDEVLKNKLGIKNTSDYDAFLELRRLRNEYLDKK